MNAFESFVRSTAIPMTPPPAYGGFHLALIFIGMTVCVLGAWFLRKLNDKKNRILLLTLSVFLIVCEVLKQIFLYFVIEDGGICWGEFPFQMCSMPMYLCPIAVFSKNEKLRTAAYTFMATFNFLGGFSGVFEPSGVFHSYVFLTVHAITWHYLLVFLGFYLIFSRRAGKTWQDFKSTVTLFLLLCFVAFIINTLVGITVGDVVNMFFVGPNNSPIIVFSAIAEKFGWVASTVIYIPVATLAAAILYLPNILIKPKNS